MIKVLHLLMSIGSLFLLCSGDCSYQNTESADYEGDTRALTPADGQASWLVMLYQDADDYQLEQDIFYDLNEAEMVGSSSEVHIVSQLDRYDGNFSGDGDWSGTKRFYLEEDEDLEIINSREMDIGEVNMSDGQSLTDFALWAMSQYPADKYAIILSDHGSGWPGGWSDPDPDEGDMLWMFEMAEAFKIICEKSGIDKLDLIGFDACLMGHMEVFSEISPYARYSVASQETEPGIGWAYSGFMADLVKNPGMDGAGLAKSIVDSYIVEDSSAEEWYRDGYSRKDFQEIMGADTTLSAIDLEALEQVEKTLDYLVGVLQKEEQNIVAKARSYAKSYTNIFDEGEPSPYIDLYHFASLLKAETKNSEVRGASDLLLKTIKKAVIAEKHGDLMKGSHGLSIYFPNSRIYSADWGGPESYSYSVPYFLKRSQWDEFLSFHYSGAEFDIAEKPDEQTYNNDETIVIDENVSQDDLIVPGKGEISIGETSVDSETITVKDFATITSDIQGNNIANIYIFVGYYDPDSDSILIADKDFVEADKTKVVDGVNYPDWEDWKDFEMEFEWEPILFSLADDTSDVFCLLEPVDYGASSDEALYMVEGEYASADGADVRYAQMYLNGKGTIESFYGFSGENNSAPHEITPGKGDQFTVYETWYGPDDSGNYDWVQEYGGTVTFGEQGVEWYDFEAYIGQYILGFIVEDFDGNTVEEYVDLEIIE